MLFRMAWGQVGGKPSCSLLSVYSDINQNSKFWVLFVLRSITNCWSENELTHLSRGIKNELERPTLKTSVMLFAFLRKAQGKEEGKVRAWKVCTSLVIGGLLAIISPA